MVAEEFFSVLMFGMAIGISLLLFIQAYGRRAARKALGGGKPDAEAQRTMALLVGENDRQAGQIDRLQERLAVLERITVDPAHRTAREIDALREA